jgi:putative ABC transport system permease protein
VSALGKKLRRDMVHLKGQVITIALVLACGVLALIMMRSTYSSLLIARDQYYADYRFADVFAHVERAPEQVARRLEALPGVAAVETRVVKDVMVPLPQEADPVTGRIVSIPDDTDQAMNALYLRSGRMPRADDEIVVLEQFAIAHELQAGDRLPVVVNGELRQLLIVGVGLSPEYVLAISGRSFMVDNKAFVVMWMRRGAVGPAFHLDGAFNDVTFELERGATVVDVLDRIDRELAPYGGFHAVPRERQMSNYALTGELDNLANLALVIPAIFLAVAAFLVNVVVSRLVFLERTQIAVLKALGYADTRIALHYLQMVAVIVAIGSVLGVVLGNWAGAWMSGMFAEFYRFPQSIHEVSPTVVAMTIAIGLGSAVAGAMLAVRRVARMPPAEAMRPPAPLTYHKTLAERLGLRRLFGPSSMMVVREIERRPVRFGLSTAGIAMGVAIFIFGNFSWDSFDYLMEGPFLREHQEDMIVSFVSPRPARAIEELEALPGVHQAEGERAVPVRARAGSRWRDVAVIGYDERSRLHRPLDGGKRFLALPSEGVVLTDRLARVLGIRVGERIELEFLEGEWPTHSVLVAGLVSEPFGLQIHARRDWLDQVLGTEPRVTTAMLAVDPARADDVRARLKDMPAVAGVTSTARIVENYRSQTGQTMVVFTFILGLSAAAIGIGIVYNNARIALSLRSRDLATLRVLGFTRREISAVLLGELGMQVLFGIPLGLGFGTVLAHVYALTISPEVMEFPVYIAFSTYATAGTIALVAGVISALLVRRKLDRLDLVAVLKSSE